MSLEAIEKVTQVENEVRERRAAAEAEAKQLVADAEKEGQALLQRTRAAGAEGRCRGGKDRPGRGGGRRQAAPGRRKAPGGCGGVYCRKGCEQLRWPL